MNKASRFYSALLTFLVVMMLVSCGSSGGDSDADTLGRGEPCSGGQALGCASGLFCKFAEGVCLEGGSSGICEEVPQVCTMDYSPVCGCDARTYPNACAAYAASVSVRYAGECTND